MQVELCRCGDSEGGGLAAWWEPEERWRRVGVASSVKARQALCGAVFPRLFGLVAVLGLAIAVVVCRGKRGIRRGDGRCWNRNQCGETQE